MIMRRAMLPMLLLPSLAACAMAPVKESAPVTSIPSADVTLTGTASYRERIALPNDARLVVRISDVSRMDAPATLIAELDVASEGRQVPLPFSLTYDAARINAGRRYAVSARIMDGAGRLIWTTDSHVELPAPGEPVELRLIHVTN